LPETKKWIECYYGQSGTGKSESISRLIERIFNETGLTARVAVGDGSAATYEGLADAGVCEIADYSIRDWPLSTLSQFCEGYWPVEPLDPKSKMVPMTQEQLKKIGLYAFEGLSVGSLYIMGDKKGGFAQRSALGEKIGQDSPIQIVDLEKDKHGNVIPNSGPGTAFGGNPLAHYGVAQARMRGLIEKSKALPGWVIWTAHERAAEDKVTNQKLIGPEVAGGAMTANLSRVFNNTLHFATVEKTRKEKDEHTDKQVDIVDAEYRIYTRDHFRPEGGTYVKYKAVCRTPDPANMPLYLESSEPGASLIEFYERIKKAREEQKARLKGAA